MKYEVSVQLKPDVLNVESKEILHSMHAMGYDSVLSLQTYKVFVLDVSPEEKSPEEVVRNIASTILTNEVIEKFSFKKLNV
ncbi:MAG: phosphoribosylformylglycinamidine synthase PurS subunit [Candidatus Deianiraeaceae bacterium]|jgi:phosphoribosylformylglycinamidine synthase PurS subunit